MKISSLENLEKDLSVLGRSARLSLTQRQKIRDKIFKQIGQLDLIDSMQTKTESLDLVMSVNKLQDIFRPRRIMLSLPATIGLIATVFVATFTTGAIARDAAPGEPLFGVRKAFEAVQVMLTTDPIQRASLQLSIAGDRISNLENVDPKNLDAVLQESQKAIATAQGAVTTLQTADQASAEELVAKLKTIVDNQKSILSTIIKNNIDNEEIKKSVLAVREELNQILPPAAVGENPQPTTPIDGPITMSGVMGSYTARPVILVNGARYFLVGSTVDLIPYMGIGNAVVFGRLEGDTIYLAKLLIDGKVIFDINFKNNPANNTTSP